MKLVAEQIKYLRERKRELEAERGRYANYCRTRESAGVEGIGAPHYIDYQEEMGHDHARRELAQIERALSKGEFVTDRNFDVIDIGTAFYMEFEDGDRDKAMLVEKHYGEPGNSLYASIESDLGNAVRGSREGDEVSYTVQATGRQLKVKIVEIDRMRENYEHFIKERAYTDRISKPATRELKILKDTNPEEYRRRHAITPSQRELLIEEANKINCGHTDPLSVSHRGHLSQLLKEEITCPNPEDDTIQIGSQVEVLLQDETGSKSYQFELINRAVSTELESNYVERISPLGTAIYGLRADDTFTIRRSHQPSINGIVVSVQNDYQTRRVR